MRKGLKKESEHYFDDSFLYLKVRLKIFNTQNVTQGLFDTSEQRHNQFKGHIVVFSLDKLKLKSQFQ